MNYDTLNFAWVFVVGLLSFFAPCNFPLIPSFIAYITGVSSYIKKDQSDQHVMIPALLFILGFMTVFLILGAGVGVLGQFLSVNKDIIRVIGGVFIIIIGLVFLFSFNEFLFKFDYHFHLPKMIGKHKNLNSFLTGLAFSFGWSPCYGPLVGAILTLVLTSGSALKGVLYFFVYSLGYAIPFLLIALTIHGTMEKFNKMKYYLKYFNFVSGLLLIIFGIIMISGEMAFFSATIYKIYNFFHISYIS